MKIGQYVVTGMMTATLLVAASAIPPVPNAKGIPAQMVVTVSAASRGEQPPHLEAADLTVLQNKVPTRIISMQHLPGDLADLQLFILLDDSTRSSSLGVQLPELKAFVESLPPAAQVAVGYMRNGTVAQTQSFTTDRQKTLGALRLPQAEPGENGSPYFVLSDLVKHWPSSEPAGRREVLMLTDGVDRYDTAATMDDPYVDAAIHDAQKNGVIVYSIYLRGSGRYGRGAWSTNFAQSHLIQVSEETGGYAYFEGFTDPVTISPFLNDLQERFDHQYQVTIAANEKGFQPVKLRTELPGVKIDGPKHVYVR
jgi:hypothetical protein